MKRLFSKDNGGSGREFSVARTAATALIGVLIVTTLGWATYVTRCAMGHEETARQIAILHQRITKEADTRSDEFESLIGRQLKLLEEQNRILYDLARNNR